MTTRPTLDNSRRARRSRILRPTGAGVGAFLRRGQPGAEASPGPKTIMHWFALVCVWLAFATSGIVFAEPAPVDALTLGLILLLPAIGLTRISSMLVVFLALWLGVAAGHFTASGRATDIAEAATFSGVSLFLAVGAFVVAAFVAHSPRRHTNLILGAWSVAAVVATACGLIGYIGLLPGAEALFTKFGRAAGTFKDPNVYGAFIVAPVIYMLHLAVTRPINRVALPLSGAAFLALGVLLCFSRGAWINLVFAVLVYGYLSFVMAATHAQRARILAFLGVGVFVGGLSIIGALQFDKVAEILTERASLVQNYDSGHEGRFGGQMKSIRLIADNPIGIGANTFGTSYHHEEVHNVYLSIFLNSGWLGGAGYWVLVFSTVALGLRFCFLRTRLLPLFLVAFSAFMGTALEGLVIDSDHWRHFYVLIGMCWGFMSVGGHYGVSNTATPDRKGRAVRGLRRSRIVEAT